MTTTGIVQKKKSSVFAVTGFLGAILSVASLFLLCDVQSEQGLVFSPKNPTAAQFVRHFNNGLHLSNGLMFLGLLLKIKECSDEEN